MWLIFGNIHDPKAQAYLKYVHPDSVLKGSVDDLDKGVIIRYKMTLLIVSINCNYQLWDSAHRSKKLQQDLGKQWKQKTETEKY